MIGGKIRELRKEKSFTQEDLAKLLGIGRATLASYETNKRYVPLQMLPIIAQFFGVSIDFLFGLADG